MKKSTFIRQVDHAALEAAIAAAEAKTSGEIRILVTQAACADPVAEAQAAFVHFGMEKTRERNAVLIFIAPASQTFAVIGDEGVHRKCGETFWPEMAAVLTTAFQRGEYTVGLLSAIERAGSLLAKHFPRLPDDTNELSDRVLER